MMRHMRDPKYGEVVSRLCSLRFHHFCKYFWEVVNPAYEFVDEPSVQVMCEHAQAISEQRLDSNNLIVNVPPRSLKSTIWNVMWPAWEWGAAGRVATRFLYSSYKADLTVRDSVACRRLVESPEFQSLWQVRLASDQNVKSRFEVVGGGYRYCIAVGSTTGEGGDITVCDDPHDAMHAYSQVERQSVIEWHNLSWFNRVNDPKTGRRVVICQRIHSKDLSNDLLKKGGWEHLNLPEEFDPERRCETSLPFIDWRIEPGELLRPQRFGEDQIEEAKTQLGTRGYRAQHQQDPMGDEGSFFQRKWFNKTLKVKPAGLRWIRYWDIAVTEANGENDPDYAVGGLLAKNNKNQLFIADIVRIRGGQFELDQTIQKTAKKDGRGVRIYIETVGQSKYITDHIRNQVLPGWPVSAHSLGGGKQRVKEVRAAPLQAVAEAGNVVLVEGPWNEAFLDEVESFPLGDHDDQVDMMSGGWNRLTKNPPVFHNRMVRANGQAQTVPVAPREEQLLQEQLRQQTLLTRNGVEHRRRLTAAKATAPPVILGPNRKQPMGLQFRPGGVRRGANGVLP